MSSFCCHDGDLAAAFEANPEGLFVLQVSRITADLSTATSVEFNFIAANSAFLRMLSCLEGSFPGASLPQILPDTLVQWIHPRLTQCLQRKETLQDLWSPEEDSAEEPLLFSLSPILVAEGRVHQIAGTCRSLHAGWALAADSFAAITSEAERQARIRTAQLNKQMRALKLQAEILDRVDNAVVVTDIVGSVIYCNASAQQIYGVSRSDALAKVITDLIPFGADQVQAMQEALRQGQSWSGQLQIPQPQGVVKTLWLTHTALYSEFECDSSDATVPFTLGRTGMISVGTDISQLKQVEQHLQEKEQFLQLVLDNIPQHIYWKDTQSVYLGCNKNWAKAEGFNDPTEVIGQRDDRLFVSRPDDARERFVMETDTPLLHWIEQKQRDGQTVCMDVNVIPIHDSQGAVVGVLGTTEDITQRVQIEEDLRQAEAKYRSIFENAVEGIFQTSLDGTFIIANPMLAMIYGYDSPAELIQSVTQIQSQLYVDPDRRHQFVRQILEQGVIKGFESQVYRRDGSIIWISESARPVFHPEGHLIGFEGTVEDISQRKQAEAQLLQRDELLQGVAEATDALLSNPDLEAALRHSLGILGQAAGVDRIYLFQYTAPPVEGEPTVRECCQWSAHSESSLRCDPNLPVFLSQPDFTGWLEGLLADKTLNGSIEDFLTAQQELLYSPVGITLLMMPIQVNEVFWGFIGLSDCQGQRHWSRAERSILMAMAGSIGAALERQQVEEQIRYQALHDPLTALPNRTLFTDRLSVALAHAQRSREQLAVLFLDLDRFKTINDTLGHAIGDQLLQVVAERLLRCLRQGDTVARWGGDEFTLLLPQLESPEQAIKAAQRILQALTPVIQVEAHELYITGTFGIAVYPQNGEDAETLIKHADAALYRAKDQGRNHVLLYTSSISSQASARLSLDNSMHRALERQELILHYQPLVEVKTGRITRMEALLRWQHPEQGMIPPGQFIPLAEENGLVVPIGEWVLRTACRQAMAWHKSGFDSLCVAVNLSARQFQHSNLITAVSEILKETGLPAASLDLEITEGLVMQNLDLTIRLMHQLRSMGVQLSMDDFGTGYSSFSSLKRFPLNTLKIDRSFIQDLMGDTSNVAIVSTVIALGSGLNLQVVAEGVETQDQFDMLSALNCDEIQGYFFSRPLSAEAATELLQHNRTWLESQQIPTFPQQA
jgi:diguanylate cyclase (GGDEF)-like protein/PAS domain S-box-containing protein